MMAPVFLHGYAPLTALALVMVEAVLAVYAVALPRGRFHIVVGKTVGVWSTLACLHYLLWDAAVVSWHGLPPWTMPLACVLGGPQHTAALLLFMPHLLGVSALLYKDGTRRFVLPIAKVYSTGIQPTLLVCMLYLLSAGCNDDGTARASIRQHLGVSAIILSCWTFLVIVVRCTMIWVGFTHDWHQRFCAFNHAAGLLVFYAAGWALYVQGSLDFLVLPWEQPYVLVVLVGNVCAVVGMTQRTVLHIDCHTPPHIRFYAMPWAPMEAYASDESDTEFVDEWDPPPRSSTSTN